jgi:hypothetical protein
MRSSPNRISGRAPKRSLRVRTNSGIDGLKSGNGMQHQYTMRNVDGKRVSRRWRDRNRLPSKSI